MVTRHEFLAELHHLLDPGVYLEIGVHQGTSLALAAPSCRAVGVDPRPALTHTVHGLVVRSTSDEWFASDAAGVLGGPVDLAFIDGLHLFEQTVRDFMGVERLSSPGGLVVFDDVLPRNQWEADRTQRLGDWTGDVWRIHPYLAEHRPGLDLTLVDTYPTGLLLVGNLDPDDTGLAVQYALDAGTGRLAVDLEVPRHVLARSGAVAPEVALHHIEERRRVQ